MRRITGYYISEVELLLALISGCNIHLLYLLLVYRVVTVLKLQL